MRQLSLNHTSSKLFEEIISEGQLRQAFKLVKANGGKAGVDGVNIATFESRLKEEITNLSKELKEWRYKPKPVKRVEIPKPGNKIEKRKLGIPCVRDRIVQASIKISIEPLFDEEFSENSYGFRPGRNQKQAILRAKQYVQEGKEWVVDIDLEKFFDRINQDRLMCLLAKKVQDKRVVRLVGLTLRSGVLHGDKYEPSLKGSTQGSPLSPLLSNIVLDELDKELEKRGLAFCRYADDANIFVGTQKAAERVLKSITHFIENRLKLKVNQTKSKAAIASAVKFLGITIVCGMVMISAVSMKRAHAKARELIPRRSHLTIEQQIEKVNRWYQGWSSYYNVTEIPAQLRTIESRLRRRFRAQFVNNHRRGKRFLVRTLVNMSIPKSTAYRSVYTNSKTWALSHSVAVDHAWNNDWFRHRQFYTASNQRLPHWQPLEVWIKLT